MPQSYGRRGLSTNPVRAVVFDVGNTLWFEARRPDGAEIARREAEAVRRIVGSWEIRLDAIEPLEELTRDIWRAYEHAWQIESSRGTLRDPSLPSLIRAGVAARDVLISVAQSEQWWRAAWISEQHFGVQLYPDVLDVLRELREHGVLIAINTNRPCTGDMHRRGLADMGIAAYVDAVVCSGDTGYVKPHRSTFDLVLRRLGVAPSEAVMVGDSCEADIGGAKAVGLSTVWKLNGRYDVKPCSGADYAIHDLTELLSLPLFGRGLRPVTARESRTPHEDGNADRY